MVLLSFFVRVYLPSQNTVLASNLDFELFWWNSKTREAIGSLGGSEMRGRPWVLCSHPGSSDRLMALGWVVVRLATLEQLPGVLRPWAPAPRCRPCQCYWGLVFSRWRLCFVKRPKYSRTVIDWNVHFGDTNNLWTYHDMVNQDFWRGSKLIKFNFSAQIPQKKTALEISLQETPVYVDICRLP